MLSSFLERFGSISVLGIGVASLVIAVFASAGWPAALAVFGLMMIVVAFVISST